MMDASGWQQSPGISSLDLYALQTLAYVPVGSVAPNFIALPEGTPYEVNAVNAERTERPWSSRRIERTPSFLELQV